jgi:signal transduction histidine kinase
VTPKQDYDAIGEDEQGTIWLATPTTIGRVIDGRFIAVSDATGRPVANVSAFTQDQRGELWALSSGRGIYRVTPGSPRLMVPSSTAAPPLVISARHGIWTGTASGAAEQHVDGAMTTWAASNAAAGATRPTIFEDGDSMWIGSASAIERIRHGLRTTWTSAQGLPSGGTRGIVADRSGHLWLLVGGAMYRVARADLDAAPDGQPGTLSAIRVETLGSTPLLPANLRNVPPVISDRQGRFIGFTAKDAVVIVNPDAITEPSMMPEVVLESVLVDGEAIDHAVMDVFVDPARLGFEYTALNLRGAGVTRFRYRLDGYDADWIDARTQRTAEYRNLRPGAYTLRIIAQGPEGVWNQTGATFAFSVVPVFWRTWWFQSSMAAFVVSIFAGLYQIRVRQLTRQFNLGLEARVAERTRIARELHDTLLQSFQGLMLYFQSARDQLPSDPVRAADALDGALALADRAIAEGRDAIQDLRSSTVASSELAQGIASFAEELTSGPQTERRPAFRVSVEGAPRDLQPIVREDVQRITREAVLNAFRHSQARTIEAEVMYGPRVMRVRIRDDGKGIDPSHLKGGREGHWGLTGMRERAEQMGAQLSLWSELGAGTEVELRIPGSVAYDAHGRRGEAPGADRTRTSRS